MTTEQPTPEAVADCAPKRAGTLDKIIAHSAGGGVVSGHPDEDACCPECAHHLSTAEHADWCMTARDPEALRRLREGRR